MASYASKSILVYSAKLRVKYGLSLYQNPYFAYVSWSQTK